MTSKEYLTKHFPVAIPFATNKNLIVHRIEAFIWDLFLELKEFVLSKENIQDSEIHDFIKNRNDCYNSVANKVNKMYRSSVKRVLVYNGYLNFLKIKIPDLFKMEDLWTLKCTSNAISLINFLYKQKKE